MNKLRSINVKVYQNDKIIWIGVIRAGYEYQAANLIWKRIAEITIPEYMHHFCVWTSLFSFNCWEGK